MIDRVFGVDFSGAAAAGNSIWIAEARLEDGRTRVERCLRASALPGSRVDRESCLAALCSLVRQQPHAIFGCDFPFSLPRGMIDDSDWCRFALAFAGRYPSAEAFLADCRQRANGREIRRECDRKAKVPFAAYNLRIYRQTYYGIRDVLAPLVRDGTAVVLPMQSPLAGQAWLIEVCPASTLKRTGLYPPYKGTGDAAGRARRRILTGLVRRNLLAPLPPDIRRTAIANRGGDALDSIVAAVAAAHSLAAGDLNAGAANPVEAIEGRVYV